VAVVAVFLYQILVVVGTEREQVLLVVQFLLQMEYPQLHKDLLEEIMEMVLEVEAVLVVLAQMGEILVPGLLFMLAEVV
jgi:glycosyltransferase A (GT-A) superfamily protein (DUF2064 family)